MKWSVLLLASGAFLTASALRLVSPSSAEKDVIENKLTEKKKFAIRCAPAYIPTADETIPALTGWGTYKWKVSTTSDSAQFYFNQGMAMYYAFHIIEARASFDKAVRFDPSFAMGWWGKALAFGPNINDFGYQRPSEAFPSAQKAVSCKANCTSLEKALINAIAVRYVEDSTQDQKLLNEKYREAMISVYKQFSNNADAAALYADAQLLLHPWDLYNHDYSAKPWTPQIITTLKQALKLAPSHPGAHHYFIHAVEASAHPEEALKSAKFLASAMPSVSHVTHMPSHIYIRTGYYNNGIGVNTLASEGYRKYLAAFAPTAEGASLYLLHNLHMKMACAQMAGNYKESLSAARDLQAEIPEAYLTFGGALGNYVQYLYQSPLMTFIRFGKWEELLQEKWMDNLANVSVLQHFGRGLALARMGKPEEASAELAQMKTKMTDASLKEPLTPFNAAYDAAVIAEAILMGAIAESQNNLSLAIRHYQKAVENEDRLIYNEPRDWVLPTRQYLADGLLKAGRYSEAVVVLKQDLTINPANGWAMTGLQLAFDKLNKSSDLMTAKQRLKDAWLIKDVEIKRPVF